MQRARILSSENDASVSQNTNVNIKISRQPTAPQVSYTNDLPREDSVKLRGTPLVGNVERSFSDLTNEIEDLEERNRVLELLLTIYEDNPLRVNNFLVCENQTLMELIKKLTNSEKVELMVDEDSGCTGCVSNTKYMNIEKILITKDGRTTEFKHSFNDVYTELIRHGISVKLCV